MTEAVDCLPCAMVAKSHGTEFEQAEVYDDFYNRDVIGLTRSCLRLLQG